jgi:glycosyltransferase involved in cell wall biosynthesis
MPRPLAVQVTSRLSVGGSVAQAIYLAASLRDHGYDTLLVHGEPPPGEGTMAPLADLLGVERVSIASLQRELGPGDVASIVTMARLFRRLRPAVVHTHAAKAGAVGRIAGQMARVPAVVHTFHGHVLRGYFPPRKEAIFRRIERGLAHAADAIVAVSDEVRDDLVSLGVAPAGRIRTIRIGFEMASLDLDEPAHHALRTATRASLGIDEDRPVIALVGRVVPVKRVDRFLAAARAASSPDALFLVVGDGQERAGLEASADARALGGRLRFLGYRDDVAAILHASDVVVLTSDLEGTPVSLIEAGACSLPVVGTAVGGVPDVVIDGVTGLLAGVDDVAGIAAAIDRLVADRPLARALGRAGRERVVPRFSLDRLAADHAALYASLLGRR